MSITTSVDAIVLFTLIKQASLLVQLVMLMLVLASLISWYFIISKWFVFQSAARTADRFEQRFWSGGNLNSLYYELSRGGVMPEGMASVFFDGFWECKRLA